MKRKKLISALVLSIALLTNCSKNDFKTESLLNNNSKNQLVKGDGEWDVLGHGYNVTGQYLDDSNISKAPVLDMKRLKADHAGKLFAPTSTLSDSEYYYGSNASNFVKDINKRKSFSASASIGSKDSLKTGGDYFTASFSSDKTNQSLKDVASRFSYGRFEETIEVKKVYFSDDVSADLLKSYLTPEFVTNIALYDANTLIQLYGTHVLLDITLGGRYVFNFTANYSSELTEEKKITKTKGGLGFFTGLFGINANLEQSKEEMTKNFKEGNERNLKLRFYGGSTSGRTISFDKDGNTSETINIGAWEQSVSAINSALIDIRRMVPLYHFIGDITKRAQVKAAIEKYIDDRQITYLGEEPVFFYYAESYYDHFVTLNPYVIQQYGSNWEFRGQTFSAFKTQKTGTIPIHEFYSETLSNNKFNSNHLTTPNRNETVGYPGWKYQGVAFYAYSSQVPGTIPIYEFYSPSSFDHFTSPDRNATVGYPGWEFRGVKFYAYP